MGGLFSSPKPTVIGPAAQPTAAVVTALPAPPSPADAASAGRAAAQQKVADGMAGLIATSPVGVLQQAAPLAARKTLLGE